VDVVLFANVLELLGPDGIVITVKLKGDEKIIDLENQ
jgi:hypothetical protein